MWDYDGFDNFLSFGSPYGSGNDGFGNPYGYGYPQHRHGYPYYRHRFPFRFRPRRRHHGWW